MKLLIPILAFASIVFFTSCDAKKQNKSENETTETQVELQSYKFAVEGMTCTGCEQTVELNVKKIEGIGSVEASHTEKIAVVTFNPAKADTADIKEAIIASGYKVTGLEVMQ